MISNGSNGTRIADGVNQIHESIGNRYAAAPRRFVGGAGATLRGMGLLVLALLMALALASSAQAQAQVPLGTADSFAVLAGSTVTNTGPSVVTGDLGVSPGSAVTGFPPGTVNGTIHAANAVAAQAQSDLTAAYINAAGRACQVALTGQDLGGKTLTRAVYCFTSSAQLTGTLTLDAQGDPNAVFIFQIGSTLTTASGSNVNLINGAQSCNVFWQVGSSATLGTTTTFRGNILALTSITATTGATVDGRLLARNGAVTLDSNTVTRAQCAAPPAPPPDETGPIVNIGGPPNRPCIARDFRLRIRASDDSGIRRIEVFLDGRLIERTTRRSFFVWIRAERLLAARHTIRVVARDRVGNRTVTTRRFRRCDRPVSPPSPPFTG
jgi:hypothetical protein